MKKKYFWKIFIKIGNFFSLFILHSETDAAVNQARKQAAIAGINVFNDVMEGRNVTDALLDRYNCLHKIQSNLFQFISNALNFEF